ncbi:MAG: response regulator transcription factor [Bacteroidetes bacterium]|nr:response regulator transcription factor [Bacteroidota bacterium]
MVDKVKYRLIILGDQDLLCDGIKEWLRDQENYRIIGCTDDWETFKKIAFSDLNLIVITTLLYIQNNPGLKEFSDFLANDPSIHAICLSNDIRDFSSLNLFESNIRGIISLSAKKDEFLFGLENVAKGQFYISTVNSMDPTLNQNQSEERLRCEAITLNQRETEILNLISLGFNDKEIGEHLHLSKRTIDGYRNGLLFKFGTKNTAQLIRFAVENNYLYNT